MDVQFKEPSYARPATTNKSDSGFAKILISLGLAKDTESANALLIILVVVVIGLAIALPFLAAPRESPLVDPDNIDAAASMP